MKFGDRVIDVSSDSNYRCQILLSFDDRCYIEYLDVTNVNGGCVRSWVSKDRIKLDIQYYRKSNINKILNEGQQT